jgi:LacI family transcriptional regulator
MASKLHEIARRCDVSVSTVIRVLAGEAVYNRPFYAQRAERIRTVANELNYRPNLAARSVRSGRFGTIVLIGGMESGVGHIGPQLVDGVCQEAILHELLLYVTRLPARDLADPARLPLMLKRRAVDGILLSYTHRVPDEISGLDAQLGLPVVWLNHGRSENAIRFDDREAAQRATRLLLERGHRRILFYAPGFDPAATDGHYSGAERLAGYQEAMQAGGCAPVIRTTPPDRDADFHARVLHADLAGPDRPSAILCLSGSDLVVYGAMRRGLRVPEDLAVCTFTRYRDKDHDLPVGRLQVPDFALGVHGVRMLQELMPGISRRLPAITLPVPLIDDRFLPPPAQG